jgi:hypothetical protein
MPVIVAAARQRSQAVGQAGARYAGPVATRDDNEMDDVLEQALIVIDERDFERSLRDPRVRAFHESATKLHAELEAEGADYC